MSVDTTDRDPYIIDIDKVGLWWSAKVRTRLLAHNHENRAKLYATTKERSLSRAHKWCRKHARRKAKEFEEGPYIYTFNPNKEDK